jgi:hypothetical protein
MSGHESVEIAEVERGMPVGRADDEDGKRVGRPFIGAELSVPETFGMPSSRIGEAPTAWPAAGERR